jgi:hypothetical protein
MDATRRYMGLLKQKSAAEEALRGLEALRPSADKLMNPEEADDATTEWLDMFNYYTNRLEEILEVMEEVEAELPDPNECPVHRMVGGGAGLCSTASRYSVPIGGNGCPFCLRDKHTQVDPEEDTDNE